MQTVSKIISIFTSRSTDCLQSDPSLTAKLQAFSRTAETFETIIGISNDQAHSNSPLGKENATKASNTVEEKDLTAARKIESTSFHNKPHVDVSDTVAYEHRFWITSPILVSSMPFIDKFDALLGAFYKSLRNQKLDIDAERLKYTSSGLDSIPRKKRSPNSPPVEPEIFKNRAMLALKEVSRRI